MASWATCHGTLLSRASSNSMSEKMTTELLATAFGVTPASRAVSSMRSKMRSISVLPPHSKPRTNRTSSPRSTDVSPCCSSLLLLLLLFPVESLLADGRSTSVGYEWKVKTFPCHGLSGADCARRSESAMATSIGCPCIEPETSHTGTSQPRSPCACASVHPFTKFSHISLSSNASSSSICFVDARLSADRITRFSARMVSSCGRMVVVLSLPGACSRRKER
mmetsp:Transcript_62568/g.129992  ORF Transcript_62568/g.129992 Transcript_62568/m.129992 type:complete len:222 (+) Transcript_62568:148-813(+)